MFWQGLVLGRDLKKDNSSALHYGADVFLRVTGK